MPASDLRDSRATDPLGRRRHLRIAGGRRRIGPRGIYLLPNLLTSGGLFCGVFSIAQTMEGFYFTSALAVLAAMLFAADGRVARITHTTSRFGIEFDSLWTVSPGVAPSLLSIVAPCRGACSAGRRRCSCVVQRSAGAVQLLMEKR
jgi:hypothetical protein